MEHPQRKNMNVKCLALGSGAIEACEEEEMFHLCWRLFEEEFCKLANFIIFKVTLLLKNVPSGK
uniref:Uncharacterized protein n=1 Tax=Octopus bimaculoides TaxID=37653 RepID=A0A0L8H9S7_OCTBM